MSTEKPIVKEEVQDFVDKNIVRLDKKGLRCGDGRNTPDHSRGMIRIFGEDFGPMLAVAATLNDIDVDVDNDAIVSSYFETVKEDRGEDARLFLHTDEHGEKEGTIGCGHANRASSSDPKYNGDGKYGVSHNSAKDLFEKAWNRPEAEHLTLEGMHDERAVLLVYGLGDGEVNFSVNSRGENGGDKYFVVDMDAIKQYFESVIPRMSRKLGVELKVENVLANYFKQQGISAELLAGHLPKFNVIIDSSGHAQVEEMSAN